MSGEAVKRNNANWLIVLIMGIFVVGLILFMVFNNTSSLSEMEVVIQGNTTLILRSKAPLNQVYEYNVPREGYVVSTNEGCICFLWSTDKAFGVGPILEIPCNPGERLTQGHYSNSCVAENLLFIAQIQLIEQKQE